MAEEEKFLNDFREISGRVIKPAMEAIVQWLQRDGGDRRIWDGESEVMHRPRVILISSSGRETCGKIRESAERPPRAT